MRDELGISLEKAGEEVLGIASKVNVSKETCVIVGDGSHENEV